jgi:hypothetical protein
MFPKKGLRFSGHSLCVKPERHSGLRRNGLRRNPAKLAEASGMPAEKEKADIPEQSYCPGNQDAATGKRH